MPRLPLEASHFRAEIARHQLVQDDIAALIGMHKSTLSKYLRESMDPIYAWAYHNIGYAINKLTKKPVFKVDMSKGVLKGKPGKKIPVKSAERYALIPLLDEPLPRPKRRKKKS